MLFRDEPAVYGAMTELVVMQTVDALLPDHCLLPSFPNEAAEAVTAAAVDLRLLLLRLCTWRRRLYQLESWSRRLAILFYAWIPLLHGCNRDNLRGGGFPFLPGCSCSSGELSFLSSSLGNLVEVASPHHMQRGVVCDWPSHDRTSDS
jgi:hypothetical protein